MPDVQRAHRVKQPIKVSSSAVDSDNSVFNQPVELRAVLISKDVQLSASNPGSPGDITDSVAPDPTDFDTPAVIREIREDD